MLPKIKAKILGSQAGNILPNTSNIWRNFQLQHGQRHQIPWSIPNYSFVTNITPRRAKFHDIITFLRK